MASARVCASVTLHPPDNRRRDADNAISSFKGGQDAVATHIGVDDANWNVSYALGAFAPPHGMVKIRLEHAND